jgi:hypothetical protein
MASFGDVLRGIATIAATYVSGGTYGWIAWAARAALVVDGANQSRRARSKAKSMQAAADFAERQQSTRSANDVGRIIYGEDIVAGSLRYWQATGTKGEFLHLVYIFAAHECDSITKVYFNDVELPAEDANGWIQSGDFCSTQNTEHQRGSRTGVGTITLPNTISSVVGVTRRDPGLGRTTAHFQYTFAGNVVTITDVAPGSGIVYEVDAIYSTTLPRVKIRKFLGAPGQTAVADLVTASGGKWTSAHRLQGLCGVYVQLEYTPEMFGQIGLPEIKANVRGHKILDPRTGTTAWTDNSALIQAHYLKTYCGATSTEVPDAMVSAEATNCDQSVVLNILGVVQKRYTCHASYSTEMTPRDILASIGETMASGVPAYAGGQFLIRAGVARTPTLTITNDMVAGGVSIQASTKRTELINRVVVTYHEPGKIGVMTEAPPVTNSTYVTADGGLDLPLNLTIEGCADSMRAQRLGKIALERARQGLRCSMQCTLDAYDAMPGDWVNVTLDRYGWSAKTFEVLSRSFDLEQGLVTYSMQEIAAGVFDWNYGIATTVDLTPNTSLPNPLAPPSALTIVSVSATMADNQTVSSLTKLTRALVVWTQSPDVFVTRGGSVEIEWMYSGETVWQAGLKVPGDDTQAYVGPLTSGLAVLVRIRAVNSLGRLGPWAYRTFTSTPSPENIPGANMVMNGGFYSRVGSTYQPSGYLDYVSGFGSYPAAWLDYGSSFGDGGRAFALLFTGASTSSAGARVGFKTASYINSGLVQGGVSGGWKPGRTYTISFYARRNAVGASGVSLWNGGFGLYWNVAPASSEVVASPVIGNSSQLYQFRFTWGATVEDSGAIFAGIRNNDGSALAPTVNGDYIVMERLMVCEGSEFPAYAPSPQDDLRAGSIVTSALADNAATDIYPASVAGVSITGQTGVPTGSFTTIATITFTAQATGNALFTASGDVEIATAASGTTGIDDFAGFSSRVTVNGSAVGPLRTYSIESFVGFSRTARGTLSRSVRFDVTAGTSYTVVLQGQRSTGTATTTVPSCECRVEVVKR